MKYDFNDLLTVSQVANYPGINRSIDTVRRWHSQHKLVPKLIDKRGAKQTRYYTKQQVMDFIKKNKDWL